VGWQPGTLKKAPNRNWRRTFDMGDRPENCRNTST
jgi:hypothetical protein